MSRYIQTGVGMDERNQIVQALYVKNMVRIFISTLAFTAIVFGIMSLKARMPEEEGPSGSLSQETQTPSSHPCPEKDAGSSSKMSEIKQDLLPVDSSEKIVEEWESLGIIPHGDEKSEELFSFSEDLGDDESEEEQDTTNAPLSKIPETQEESPRALPTRSQPVLTKPNLIRSVTLKFDNDAQPPHPEEDPTDPTSKGTGPHGGHKGGRAVNLNTIPIIRMGENFPQEFKVIEP